MRSLWSVSHIGAHTTTTIKKLERFLDVKALDIERERYVWNGEKLERAVFFVDHGTLGWHELVVSLLQKTLTLATACQTRGDAVQTLSAEIAQENIHARFKSGIPSGLREISWTVRADQTFSHALLAAGSAVARWWTSPIHEA